MIMKRINIINAKIAMMKKFLFLLLMLPFAVFGQNQRTIKITHGPYLCDMSSEGVTIVWTTDVPALSWVEIAPHDNEHFYGREREKFFDVAHGKKRADRTLHRVRVTGLEPGAQYRYRVFSQHVTLMEGNNRTTYGQTASTDVYRRQPLSFRTFDPDAKEINFVVVNDIHTRNDLLKELFADVDVAKLDFVALNGDMAHWIEDGEQLFSEFMDTCVDLFAKQTPVVFVRGNHETRGKMSIDAIDYFPTSTGMYYYTFNIGAACFMVLDCGEDKPDSDLEYGGMAAFDPYRVQQAAWLSAQIERPELKNATAKIALLHIPPPVGNNWHGQLHLKETLLPILNRADTDVMLSGHTHRHSFRQPDDEAQFHLLVNSNEEALHCTLKSGMLTIKAAGAGGKNAKQFEIPVKF